MTPRRTALLPGLSALLVGCAPASGAGGDSADAAGIREDRAADPYAGLALENDERSAEVIFSPQPLEESHNARVAEWIEGAQASIDVMMYRASDARIHEALGEAAARGVKVRFLFDTAAQDKKLSGDALAASKSGQLEQKGINVRYVNKILHHKLMIVDGPRDDAARAKTAKIASGSANWSISAATKYDENTLFLTGHEEMALQLQREHDLLWEHSRDLVVDASLPFELSSLTITQEMVPDDPDLAVFFTSANFTASGDTFSTTGANAVADELVKAIQRARTSIHVASGHLRSRPVAQALMAKKVESPSLDVRIYLDGQEYVSESGHAAQVKALEKCLTKAGAAEAARRACLDRGFRFGYQVGESGIDVRYKYYAYRWHAAYAKQMHNKVLIVDGTDLYTGSYNLSDNAEHETFENMMLFRGPQYTALVDEYEDRFEALWETGRPDDLLGALRATVATAETIPLVFEAMALTHAEVTSLKALIRESCPAVNSPAFRSDPVGHQVCRRD